MYNQTKGGDDGLQLRQNLKALSYGTYRLVREVAATMALQGGLPPQLFDNKAVWYFLDRTIDMEADFEHLPKEKSHIIRRVLLYWLTYFSMILTGAIWYFIHGFVFLCL